MTNLYDQADFKSRDVALTFHVGLMARLLHQQTRTADIAPDNASLLRGTWRRWEQAFETFDGGNEAETYQATGARLRECLLSFLDETRTEELVPTGINRPKDSDFTAWTDLLTNALTPSRSARHLRSYLKKTAVETWEYVNWLTHYKHAVRMDAEIGLKMVEHLLAVFTAARLRLAQANRRCAECGSYSVAGGVCGHCGWEDPDYQPPQLPEIPEEERAQRLAERCTPSSDIATFITPHDFP